MITTNYNNYYLKNDIKQLCYCMRKLLLPETFSLKNLTTPYDNSHHTFYLNMYNTSMCIRKLYLSKKLKNDKYKYFYIFFLIKRYK